MLFTSLYPGAVAATTLLAQYCLAQFPHNGYSYGAYSYWGYRTDQGPLASFIASEGPRSLQGILDNIGPSGGKVAGAGSGFVIASPSKADPDCTLSVFFSVFVLCVNFVLPIIMPFHSYFSILCHGFYPLVTCRLMVYKANQSFRFRFLEQRLGIDNESPNR